MAQQLTRSEPEAASGSPEDYDDRNGYLSDFLGESAEAASQLVEKTNFCVTELGCESGRSSTAPSRTPRTGPVCRVTDIALFRQ
jgi:hypothetical protein